MQNQLSNDTEKKSVTGLDGLHRRLRLVRYVLGIVAVFDGVIFVSVGIEYMPWCLIASALVLTKIETSKPEEILDAYCYLPTALYLAIGISLLYNFIWASPELTFIRLTTEPLRFLWFKAYFGPIALLGWLMHYFRRTFILNSLLDRNPNARKFFSPETSRKYTFLEIGFVCLVISIGFLAKTIVTFNHSYIDRAIREANAQMKPSHVAEYKYFVEWLNADNAANPTRIWGKVSVYDGRSLQSVPVEWAEK